MNLRLLVLLTATGAGLSAPLLAHALPLHLSTQSGTAQILLVDEDGDEDENTAEGGDDDSNRKGGKAAMNCGEGEGEDDDEGACATGQGAAPQNANPPANGLITPGSKPQVQIN